MIKVDIRSENSAYITIGKWVIYVDDSTGEQIIDSWEDKEIEEKKNEKKAPSSKLQAPSRKLRHFVARHYVTLTQDIGCDVMSH